MNLHPIFKTLLRNKLGVLVIATQVALTLAIASNVFYIVTDRVAAARRPTGVDEPNLFRIGAIGYREVPDQAAQQRADEALLARIPGVVAVSTANQVPLGQSGSRSGFYRNREDQEPVTAAARYEFAGSPVQSLGLRLIDGRDFQADEYHGELEMERPARIGVIVSHAFAKLMYPDAESYAGRVFYMGNGDAAAELRVIGVVEELVTPWGRTSWSPGFGEESLVLPTRSDTNSPRYVVRTEPGRLREVMAMAEQQLVPPGSGRVLNPAVSFSELRERRYRSDYFLSSMMAVMTVLLVLVTASGILGMVSFWVGQRRKQIGVRRALGARRGDILRYYLLENLAVTGLGIGIGIVLAIALNLLVAESLQLSRLPFTDVLLGALLLTVVGQLATLVPARRAAQIAPATATRSV